MEAQQSCQINAFSVQAIGKSQPIVYSFVLTKRELATKRNDTKIIAVTSDDLIAKEVCYHFTCYREYTRPIKPTSTHNQDNDVTVVGTSEVIKFLVGLHEKPDIVEFRKLQNMVTTESGKKNLKRNIEAKTKAFKFINYGKEILVYPVSMKVDDLVIMFHEARTYLTTFENMDSKEKTVLRSANIIREEIKSLDYKMP